MLRNHLGPEPGEGDFFGDGKLGAFIDMDVSASLFGIAGEISEAFTGPEGLSQPKKTELPEVLLGQIVEGHFGHLFGIGADEGQIEHILKGGHGDGGNADFENLLGFGGGLNADEGAFAAALL